MSKRTIQDQVCPGYFTSGNYEITLVLRGHKPTKKIITMEKGGKLVVDETIPCTPNNPRLAYFAGQPSGDARLSNHSAERDLEMVERAVVEEP